MEKQGWKTMALIFIFIFILENIFLVIGYIQITDEENKTMECYYEVCEDYIEAEYDPYSKLCSCYVTDVLGYLVVNKSRWLG